MSEVNLESIPQSLKGDKSVKPFVSRSVELESINPIISFYCKIYVLEHILTNKLHTQDKEVERFTILLLDETEQLKNTEDESLHKVLNDKSLSLSAVMSFAYQIFNQCLRDLQMYDGTTKAQLVSKFRAGLNFMALLGVFTNAGDGLDYAKLTGGKATDAASFEELNKSKVKLLKFQLSKILKDEVTMKDDGLEAELDRELENIKNDEKDTDAKTSSPSQPDIGTGDLPSAPKFIDEDTNDNALGLPPAPKSFDANDDLADKNADEVNEGNGKSIEEKSNNTDNEDFSLPRAPHTAPDDDDADIKLPGAPKFLPDNDLSHINRSSSIHVFPPGKPDSQPDTHPVHASLAKPARPPQEPSKHEHLTKENVSLMVDKADQITKIQKHAKFAISALNYEDIETAERELLQGLELLRAVKN